MRMHQALRLDCEQRVVSTPDGRAAGAPPVPTHHPRVAPRASLTPHAKCFRVAADVASAAAWRRRRKSGRLGAVRESGWISCETGTCGSSSAACRSCPSVILRSRPAGNWWPRSAGWATGLLAPAERLRGAGWLTRRLRALRHRPPGSARCFSSQAGLQSPSFHPGCGGRIGAAVSRGLVEPPVSAFITSQPFFLSAPSFL